MNLDLEGPLVVLLEHRDEIPFSDQLPTLDPPTHTDHRALLMRLITPKRLKENEDAMWQLADDILDDFLAPGEGEFIKGFAGPFTLRVIADLLGVPDEDAARHRREGSADLRIPGLLASPLWRSPPASAKRASGLRGRRPPRRHLWAR